MVRSFIQRGAQIGIEDHNINLSDPFIFYHNKVKQLDIHIRFQSEQFLDWFFNQGNSPYENEKYGPEVFVKYLQKYYVFPEELSEITVVPKKINLYGYWDNSLIAINHFTLINGSYRMNNSDSQLYLAVDGTEWYLEYSLNNSNHRISIMQDNRLPFFKKSFW